MLFYIWAAEDYYQGLHGIENYGVFDCRDVTEANNMGLEMSIEVIDSYNLINDYSDYGDWDEDTEEYDYGDHLLWEIFKIKDEYVNMGAEELNRICRNDPDDFVKKYTEEVDF